MRLGLHPFVHGPFVQIQANRILFKDEKQTDWFNPDSSSDASSTYSKRSATSRSSRGSGASEALIVYNVPIWLRDSQLKEFRHQQGFPVDTLTRSTWNPGKFPTVAWKMQGNFASTTSSILHDSHRETGTTIIPFSEFNVMKREYLESRKRGQASKGQTTYVCASRRR